MAIARSLIRLSQVECLIFDEPTSALDPKNEQELYRIFRTIAQDRMAVVVSHRLALAKLADRIVVLEHGEVIRRFERICRSHHATTFSTKLDILSRTAQKLS